MDARPRVTGEEMDQPVSKVRPERAHRVGARQRRSDLRLPEGGRVRLPAAVLREDRLLPGTQFNRKKWLEFNLENSFEFGPEIARTEEQFKNEK